ncbi:hypothetical protein [Algivirga pacifica]
MIFILTISGILSNKKKSKGKDVKKILGKTPEHLQALQLAGPLHNISPNTAIGSKALYQKDGIEVYVTVTKIDRSKEMDDQKKAWEMQENAYKQKIQWLLWAIVATFIGGILEWGLR